MKKKLFSSIYYQIEDSSAPYNGLYNGFMLITIVLSLLSLMFKTEHLIIQDIENFAVGVFIIDYIIRWLSADDKFHKGFRSYLIYPFTFWAIIDLLSILPSFQIISRSFEIFKALRITKLLRGLRILKFLKFSKDIQLLLSILQREKNALISFGILTLAYIFITALILFNIEPETFHTFFDAIYWATISLTTVGYGDIYAHSIMGKIITMISSLFGIALIAMPASIITTGLLEEVEKNKKRKRSKKELP